MRTVLVPLVLTTMIACAKEAPTRPPPAAEKKGPDWASAFRHTEKWDPARNAVVAELVIAPGFHAYTTGETVGKPLALEIDESGDYLLAGPVILPEGKTKDLPLGRSVIVEGNAEIVAPVKPKANPGGTAKGTLRYQICTDTACDRPRSTPFTVAITAPK